MPTHYFLKLGLQAGNRIVGNSTHMDFPGWIEIESWGPVQRNESSGGPGKTSIQEFHFTRLSDKTLSPRIFHACHTAEYFDGAIFAIEGPGAPHRIQFNDVLITSCRTEPSGSGLPADSFTINFAGIKFTAGATPTGRAGHPTINLPADRLRVWR